MRIMLVGAGNSNHTLRWANAMSMRGHEVLLVARSDQKVEFNNLKSTVKTHYLKHGGKLSYYLNVLELKSVFKEYKPDVVNVHYITGYLTMARLANLHPVVASCWGSDVFIYPWKRRINRHLICKNIKYADSVASTSIAMADELRKVIDDSNCHITITPFGVDTNLFRPNRKNKSSTIVIGIVKYLEPIYDIPLLINAFHIVKQSIIENVVLKIYGSGSLKSELVKMVESLGIVEQVEFHESIPNEEVPDVLNTFDIFVNCSITESFGVAVVEAMACELPVIVTDTKGYREIVVDNETGLLLKDRNPQTMADAIIRLIKEPELRTMYGINGRNRVLALYDWNNNVTTMEELYKNTLNTYAQ